MKKILICTLLAISTASFASEIKDTTENLVSGSTSTETTIKGPKAMNALPVNKDIDESKVQKVDQPKQPEQLVGSNSATWTPAYLEVKSYKKCLAVQEYRGWEGLCMPTDKPENCPSKSWSKLQEMNLVPCTEDES